MTSDAYLHARAGLFIVIMHSKAPNAAMSQGALTKLRTSRVVLGRSRGTTTSDWTYHTELGLRPTFSTNSNFRQYVVGRDGVLRTTS